MPTKKSGLSFVTLVRTLILSGTLVYYVNLMLLVSLGNFLIGSKTTDLTEDNVLSFLVSILIGQNICWCYTRFYTGRILFSVFFFINDIVNEIGSCTRLFADDTSLFIIVNDPTASAEQLNADLIKILQWAETWLVTFNPNKTESLITSHKPLHLSFYMNNQQVLEVDC